MANHNVGFYLLVAILHAVGCNYANALIQEVQVAIVFMRVGILQIFYEVGKFLPFAIGVATEGAINKRSIGSSDDISFNA